MGRGEGGSGVGEGKGKVGKNGRVTLEMIPDMEWHLSVKLYVKSGGESRGNINIELSFILPMYKNHPLS